MGRVEGWSWKTSIWNIWKLPTFHFLFKAVALVTFASIRTICFILTKSQHGPENFFPGRMPWNRHKFSKTFFEIWASDLASVKVFNGLRFSPLPVGICAGLCDKKDVKLHTGISIPILTVPLCMAVACSSVCHYPWLKLQFDFFSSWNVLKFKQVSQNLLHKMFEKLSQIPVQLNKKNQLHNSNA